MLGAPSPDVAVSALRVEPPHVDVGSLPVSYVSKYHAQDELGQVSYGYSHPGQAKDETRDASGNVAGVYTYVDNNNKLTRVEYTAGQEGFQVRSNNLPVQTNDTPEVLAAKLKFVEAYNGAAYAAATADDAKSEKTSQAALPFASQSVKDTPEVIAAKLQFLEAYNAAAIAAAIANDAESNDTSRAIITYAFHPVQDTPEVTAAKLKFVEAYNAAALAAAAANDSESNDISKIISSYATHVVQDTPEVIAAKLKFFEAYNAAAIAAASAPDDAVTSITVKPNANESRRDSIQTSPRTRKFNVLRPVKVIDTPNIEAENNEKNYNTVPFATTLASNDVLFRLSVNLNSNEPVTAISETSTEEKQEATVSPNEDKYGELATIIPYIIESPLRSSRSRKYPELIPVKMTNTPNTEVENNVYSTKVPQVHSQGAIPSVQAQPEETTVPIFPAIQSAIPTVTYQTPDLGLPFMYVSRHHVQDELGRVDYGFSYPGQSKHEVRDSSGNVIGVYSYSDDDNKLIQVEYTAGKDGVTVKSNILPESVTDTPEVLAAKHQFVEAYNSAAIAAAAAPNRDSVDSIKLVFNNPVKDTAIQYNEQFPDSTLAKTGHEDVPVIQRPLVIVPVTYTTQYHTQDELGRVRYGFSYPGHTKYEVRDATGNVAGAYSYMTPEDKVIQVVYTAGDNGFQV
ncbi:hypothetical protein SK128_015568 [Halocaridina rubra]|uniref:Cuticle protein 6 n=1 Tax=Halocaridina rubra TaxID=373956 RepID=A0AAN8XCH6_HALRR